MKNIVGLEKALVNKLKLKHLSLLVAIDRYQNILKAAQNMNMAQPAATRMLHEVEDILGATLFERLPRGVKTTPYGRIILRHSKIMLEGLRHASEEVICQKEGITGHVRIGTVLAAASVLLPSAIAVFKSQRPDVLVTISDGTNEQLLASLYDGDLDIVISRMQPYVLQKSLVHETLYDETMCVVARRGHPKAGCKKIPLTDLAGYQWILPIPQTKLREQFDQAFTRANVPPPVSNIVESVSLQINLALLLKTDMLTFLPYNAVKPYISLGLLDLLDTEFTSVYGPIGVSHRGHAALSSAAQFMLDCLKEETKNMDTPVKR